MLNDLPTSPRVRASDDDHEDGLLMHELTVLNGKLGKYVLRYLDEDARRATPIPIAEERALAERLTAAADGIQARAARRERSERP